MNSIKKVKSNDDDESCFRSGSAPLGFTVKTKQVHNFMVHINEDIKAPDHYAKIFDMLLDAGPEDIVSFFIASPGGRIDGLNVLLEGLRMTEAYTVAVLIGEAHSAASILALNCDEVVVTDSAESLVHSCRFGASGKAADIAAQTAHTIKITEKIARQTYSGFLTEDELSLMLAGKEYYFDAEEIKERLERRAKFLEDKSTAEENKADNASKPSRKKKTPVES